MVIVLCMVSQPAVIIMFVGRLFKRRYYIGGDHSRALEVMPIPVPHDQFRGTLSGDRLLAGPTIPGSSRTAAGKW